MALKSMIHRVIATCYPGHYGTEAVRFLEPVLVAARLGSPFPLSWKAPGPWTGGFGEARKK